MWNLNKTRYLLRSGNSVKRKTTPGQPNLGTPLSKNKASYKTLVLTYPYAVVIPLTLTRSLSWALPNQISYLKGFLMDSFTFRLTLKIDFTRTIEHTPKTAWELVDLRFSLNPLSKLREFNTEFCTIDNLGPSIYRLIENLNLLRFGLWLSSVRMEVSHVRTVFCDCLSKIAPFCIWTEHWNILKCWTVSGRVATSSRRLAETSQTMSTSEIQLRVEWWLTLHPDGVALSFRRLQYNLLDTPGSPDAFKGSSGRLHRNRLIWLGICKDSSWTSSRSLWSVTWALSE
jgi:hypothetical protein